ncbi:MAG: hypothetical protein ACFHWX_10705 [Bacteroidota bacterium]
MIRNIALVVLSILLLFMIVFSQIQAGKAAEQQAIAFEIAAEANNQGEIANKNASEAQRNADEATKQAARCAELLNDCQK